MRETDDMQRDDLRTSERRLLRANAPRSRTSDVALSPIRSTAAAQQHIAKSPTGLRRKGFRCYCNILVPKVGLEPTRF